ncbi:tetratricopeptide repeat protein [Ornithinimicrobium panacihumi]|uniref:serine/threonine-protein kinase n=1 Tax=Ornithinimicrobium panacihumi TaxID=2008449 RepID=UPI003F8AF67F
MNRCVEPGCTGSYEDGWCNVCGSPEPSQAPVAAPPAPEPVAAPAADPSTAAGRGRAGEGRAGEGQGAGSDGIPAGSAASAAPQVATPAPGQTREALRAAVVRRQRALAGVRRSKLGMGLTQVPPVPPADPTQAVMEDPQVPEDRRVCPNCGADVGRSAGEAGGRQQGFCPQCRAPYSFTPKLSPGDLVAGQYEVVGALAHGGMGWIYLARDKNVSDRWVVLKGLLNTGDADALEAAVAEQQFLAQVKHPLIVEIYNVVTHDGDAYTVMEYVGGTSLKQMLKARLAAAGGRYNPFPVDQALAFVLETLPAFSHLHDLGLLYCDFKPDNLIQEGDAVKLIDLGGVRRQDDLDSPIYGTVGYQAPEVAEVGPSVASDIYTIGRTLCVLTFEFRGYQSEYVDSLPPASQVPPFVEHDAFFRLVARCCAPDPNDRFLTIDELRSQMIGVLRQVVAASSDHAATLSAHSAAFEQPVSTGETLSWWELPDLKRDDTDPMLDWLSSLPDEPMARHQGLLKAAEQTPEVLLARARTGIQMGQEAWVDQAVRGLLAEDPWDWRASWVRGLWALSLASGDDEASRARRVQQGQLAAGHFAAVRDALPGEIAPRLALALASELGNYSKAAELDYERAWRTDAAYVAPAAFGLHRVRRGRGDEEGAIAALDSVPASSRAHPLARWLRAEMLRARGTLADLRESVHAVSRLTLDPRQRAQFNATIYEQALEQVGKHGEKKDWRLGEVPVTQDDLRKAVEKEYRVLADYTPDPLERAALIDRANAVRPWSWT